MKLEIWKRHRIIFIINVFLAGLALSAAEVKKSLTFQDMMQFRSISGPVISEDGTCVAYALQPGRGDGEVRVQRLTEGKIFASERGGQPAFTKDARWLAASLRPRAEEMEKPEKDRPKNGMALLNLVSGQETRFEKVEKFVFSNDSLWLAYQLFKEEEPKKKDDLPKEKEKEPASPKMKDIGTTLVLRRLGSGDEVRVPHVLSFAYNEKGSKVAYAVADPEGKTNGLFVRDLGKSGLPEKALNVAEKGVFSQPTWQKQGDRLAYLSTAADEKGNAGPASLWIWDEATGNSVQAVSGAQTPENWLIPSKAKLTWSEDEKRIFFGLMPKEIFELRKEPEPEGKEAPKAADLYDMDKILEKRGVDVWHWNDPRIIPHQKKEWPRLIEKTYTAVYQLEARKMVRLADLEMPDLEIPENPRLALGFSSVRYLKEVTWDDRYQDVYVVDLAAGKKKKILDRLRDRPSLSADGRYVLYFKERNWHLYDIKSGAARDLTGGLQVSFDEEEEDRPQEPGPYGFGGWLEDGSAVLLYDRFDIWKISTLKAEAVNLTAGEGRKTGLTFRILRLDPEQKSFKRDQTLLLSAYHNRKKFKAFYGASIAKEGVYRLLEDKKTFNFVAKAQKADVLLFTRESYDEFPDIWLSDLSFRSPRRLSEANPQVKDFAWGASELVEWQSQDGLPLQGVLIKPGNYEPGQRYPVLIYFYERMSERLHQFNPVIVNHRPCFPFYASNGYALFLPDIVYETGRPGLSAVKCLIPGVQKIIDLGVADPKAIALHGHSWGGYETAFVITQTNLFRAAIAGAAVGNMTSAYSGIRWESGLARQFQYEKDQSRIGRSLWENRDLFIENSPVFYADRIQTPLLLMAGDEDGAVPWEQGIELYLAMRRLGKDCIFLQYRGEPHHPQKFANKLDYSIRMKQYLDHYLKGEPAPDWISRGVSYQGK